MSQILVTGATGFIGSALVRALVHRGDTVRALVRAGSNRDALAGLDVECVTGDVTQLEITSADGVAFSRSFSRLTGRKSSGEEMDLWVRATICYRRIGGEWKVAHEHISVPFYMDGSFRAAVDLYP